MRKLEKRCADPPGSLRESQDRELRVSVRAATLEGRKKRAEVRLEQPVGSSFEVDCDEGAALGGEDTASPTLAYFSAAVAS